MSCSTLNRLLATLVLLGVACAAHADHKEVAPLPAKAAEAVRAAQQGRPDPLEAAIKRNLEATLALTERGERDAAKFKQKKMLPHEVRGLLADRKAEAAAKRQEMLTLKGEVLQRVAREADTIAARGASEQAAQALELHRRLATRFDLAIQDLDELSRADPATLDGRARQAASRIRSWLTARPAEPLPAPNWRQAEPVRPMKLPEAVPPRFVADAWWLMQQQFASRDGLVRVALRPTPAEAVACGYGTADLAGTAEAPTAHPDIVALAKGLDHNPVRMFEWVQQNIGFEPYYGSLKGAVATLWAKAGGATDQASLLIALLRASNIPARYVRGNVAVLDSTALGADGRGPRWIGARSYQAAATVLGSNGNPYTAYRTNGIDLAHVWVEACLPYADWRGSGLDDSGHRWVPLDPSYKDRRYQAGVGVDGSFDFGYDSWLASRLDAQGSYRLPQERFEEEVAAHVKSKAPDYANTTLEEVPYKAEITRGHFDILPIVPPYEVLQYSSWDGTTGGLAETAALPERHRYRLSLVAMNSAGSTLAQKTLNLTDLATRRLTLAYRGATPADQSAFDAWFDAVDPAAAPTCAATANMVPLFRLEGVEQASEAGSGSVPLCSSDNRLTMTVTLAELGSAATRASVSYSDLRAANLHALHAYAWHTSDTYLVKRSTQLLANLQANNGNVNADRDAIEGEFLNIAASKYSRYVADASKRAGELFGESGTVGTSLGLTSAQVKVAYLFDLPYGLYRRGFLIDWPGGKYTGSRLDMPSTTDKRAFKLAGFAGSAYEAYIWQELANLDAVSTTRGLQFAAEQGVEILQINSSGDWAAQKAKLTSNTDPGLNYAASHVAQIEAKYVNKGFKLTLPRRLIRYPDANGWLGATFYAERLTPNAADIDCPYVCASFPINGYSGGVTIEPAAASTGTSGGDSGSGSGSASGGYGISDPLGSLYDPSLGSGIVADPYAPTFAQQSGQNGYQSANGFGSGTAVSGDPVNMVTGNLIHSERDIAIKGRGGLPIVFERWYNSRNPQDGPLGFGWTHSFNHVLRFYGVEGGQAKLGWSDGTGGERYFATPNHTSGNIAAGATFTGSAGIYATLERLADGQYRISERSGMKYLFESVNGSASDSGLKARLLSITDRNGNALSLSYAPITGCPGSWVCKVSDSLGRALTFGYTANRISQISDWSGRSWQYSYDGNGDLTRFRNPLAVAGSQPAVSYQYHTAADGARLAHTLKQYQLPRGNGMRFAYYQNGRVFRHTPFGADGVPKEDHATTFAWSEFRREARQIDALGHTRTFLFDAHGNPLAITDEAGATTDYTYDPAAGRTHLRLTRTDPLGMLTQYAYDSQGNLTDLTLPSGRTLQTLDHTAYGQPQRVKDADGHWTLNRFDAQGRLTDVIRVKNGVTPVANTKPANADILAWTQYQSDSVGNPVKTRRLRDWTSAVLGDPTSGVGPSLETTWDASQLNITGLTRRGDLDGTPASLEVETTSDFAHDSLGRTTRGPDGAWYPADFQYDPLDRPLKTADGRGHLWDTVFDANGNPLMVGLTVNGAYLDGHYATWDELDRLERRVDYAGHATLTQYDPLGRVSQVTEADGYTLAFDRDPLGRVTGAYDEEGHRVSLALDADGRPRSSTDPNNLTTAYEYYHATQDGRLKKTTLPKVTGQANGRKTEIAAYDGQGRPTRINSIAADGSVRDTYRFYDELGRLTREVGPPTSGTDVNRPVSCVVYTPLGDVKELWAGSSTDTTSKSCALDGINIKKQLSRTFDDFGRKLTETDALGNTWTWSWNRHHELVTSQTPVQAQAGQSTTYAYGAQGNPGETQGLLKTRSVPGTNGQTVTYTRDALGLVTRAETRTPGDSLIVSYSYAYDPAKRLASVTDSRGNKTLTYTWTPGGRLAQLQDADGHVASFAYDATGRLATITAPNGENVAFVWDAGGRLIEQRLHSGQRTTQSWFEDGNLKQRQTLFNTSTLSSHLYTLDNQGRRATQSETINGSTKNWTYAYDYLDRLTSASDGTAETYAYDIWDNRRSKTKAGTTTAYLFNAAHQLSEIRSGSDTGTLLGAAIHDADGHLSKLCEVSPGGTITKPTGDCSASGTGASTLTLVWNALDHLQTATRSGSGAIAESYQYDDQGRRIAKTSAATTTHWLYDGDAIHAEWTGTMSGLPGAVYAHGGLDQPLVRLTGTTHTPAATQSAYLQDGLGSVVGLANASGTLTASQRFDAWGNRTASTGTIPQYGYTGREPDATGLVYYRARYYHPGIGRFASRDPMGMADAVSPYAYVANNPVNYVDPTGEFLDVIADIGFIAYDLGVLGYDLYKTGGQNLGVHATALALDVGGAVLPFVTGAGQAYRAGNTLVDVARQADNAISAGGSAATRGTKVHTEFDTALKNGAGGKNISPESAYLNRVPDERYRPRGSSNPDAVVGNIRQPTAVFDLKTGKSGISNSQMAKYNDNLPEGTPIFTVTPNGHNAPRPQSMSGMGAVLNTGSLLGGSLYGDDSVPYLGGNSGGGLVDPRLYK
ncbi:MAG TPA: RHS repeat-associated core domain-containing protein [Burkholderiaceae bacterium]|nr:RHS repeat-associated core domain-containing protein [Burkholderiaceae bacterium]